MESLLSSEEAFLTAEKVNLQFSPAESISKETISLDGVTGKVIKRVVDILFSSLIILLVLSWLIPLIAILIKLDSKGPVFFLQKRNGRKRIPFTCIKFRSMIVNEESDMTPTQVNDHRITRVGKVLRNYYMDEFPQFLNVWWGNMTLVGPRPHMIRENQRLEHLIANYSFRYHVKPGITGLGQVNNDVTATSLQKMENRTYWDTLYIKNWSYQLDIKIIFRTLILCINNKN